MDRTKIPMVVKAITLAAAALFMTPASALEVFGKTAYGGLSLGQGASVKGDRASDFDAFPLGAFGGVQISPRYAAELDVEQIQDYKFLDAYDYGTERRDGWMAGASIVRDVDLIDGLDTYVRGGLHKWDTGKESGYGPTFGIGIDRPLTERVLGGLEYRARKMDEVNFGADWLHTVNLRIKFH